VTIALSAALHQGILGALDTDPALGVILGATGRVFDRAPDDYAPPYVTINEASFKADDNSTGFGGEHLFDIHAWSRSGSRGEAWSILDRCERILRDPALTLEGSVRLIYCRRLSAFVTLDPDGETFHGVLTVRVLTEE